MTFEFTEKCGLSLRLTTVDCRVYVDDNHVIFQPQHICPQHNNWLLMELIPANQSQ